MNIWRLIAHHYNSNEAIVLMENTNRLAIGWSNFGDLNAFRRKEEIAKAIKSHYPDLNNSSTGGPSLWNFYKNIQLGDLVIVNVNHKRNSVFEIIGNYEYVSNDKSLLGYRHQRKAILRDINAEELWQSVNGITKGENIRWTLAKCTKTNKTENLLFEEGKKHSVTSSYFERSSLARQACIKYYGYKCQICSFDFTDIYGDLGKDFIHVHHIKDISLKDKVYDVDSIKDLIPVCPNCHAMLHRRKPAIIPEKLKQILKSNNYMKI